MFRSDQYPFTPVTQKGKLPVVEAESSDRFRRPFSPSLARSRGIRLTVWNERRQMRLAVAGTRSAITRSDWMFYRAVVCYDSPCYVRFSEDFPQLQGVMSWKATEKVIIEGKSVLLVVITLRYSQRISQGLSHTLKFQRISLRIDSSFWWSWYRYHWKQELGLVVDFQTVLIMIVFNDIFQNGWQLHTFLYDFFITFF